MTTPATPAPPIVNAVDPQTTRVLAADGAPAPPLDAFIGRALSFDSRAVRSNDLFVAVRGAQDDGARFAEQAVANGAAAIVADLEGALRVRERLGGWPVPMIVSSNPRRLAALLAARAWPGQPETLVAVTGTNGKTSVASFAGQIFGALGCKAATFGTIGLETFNVEAPDAAPIRHTTLEPTTLHPLLARLAELGVTHAAMEASSHGLAQHRTDGATLKAAALTNLSRDHLDYHADAAAYLAAKLRLFAELSPPGATAVLNADDASFPAAAAVARARGLRLTPVGRAAEAASDASDAPITVLEETPDADGLALRFRFGGVERRARLPLIGAFQGANALMAAGLAIGAGAPADAAFDAIERLVGVRGRMELAARRGNGAGVFIDYAHTPDALATALAALRPHTPGRLHVVFGAGGDRDPGKRPLMGAAAAGGADRVIVTDDNPRSEDPGLIRRQVRVGCPDAIEVGDRAEAILRGVDGLEPGDALLVAGKGHEQGQIVAGDVSPFDDAEQARAAAAALDGAAARLFR